MSQPNWFLALPLPASGGQVWLDTAATAPVPLRRIHPADLHLTLAFLGPCGGQAARNAWHSLEGLTHAPIRIRAAGWRALGPPAAPSAYGLTMAEGHDSLCNLLTDWGARALAAAGGRPDRRPPLPHLTLLRPRRREAAALRVAMADWMTSAPLPLPAAQLSDLALYTWSDERRQRLFRIVQSRPLASPAPAEPPTWGE